MPAPAFPPALEGLLPRFILRDRAVERDFNRLARPYLMEIAEFHGWFLPSDQHEDIVQQAFLLLLDSQGKKFDSKRGTAKAFLRLLLRRAVREVTAASIAAGKTTRPPKLALPKERRPVTAAPPMPELKSDDIDLVTVDGGANAVEVRHDVNAILRAAPAEIAKVLTCFYLLEQPVKHVAAEMNVSRYALGRKIKEFAEKIAA